MHSPHRLFVALAVLQPAIAQILVTEPETPPVPASAPVEKKPSPPPAAEVPEVSDPETVAAEVAASTRPAPAPLLPAQGSLPPPLLEDPALALPDPMSLSSGFGTSPADFETDLEPPKVEPLVPPLNPVAPVIQPSSGYASTPNPFAGSRVPLINGATFGLATSIVHDTNFNQSPDTFLNPARDETIYTISPTFLYRHQGAALSWGVNAALNYNGYFHNSDFNGFGYQLQGDLAYQSAMWSVTGSLGTSRSQGTNRYAGGQFTESTHWNASLGASYQWRPRTSFDGRFSYNTSHRERGNLSDTENLSADLSAMWKATPFLRIGPGISWSSSEGSRHGDRQSIGPILRAQYQPNDRFSFDGTIGAEFTDFSNRGGSDTNYTASIGASYRPSPLWGADFSLSHGTYADAYAAGAFRESTDIRLGYTRQISRFMLSTGLAYSFDDSSRPTGIGGRGSSEYVTFDASLGTRVWEDRIALSLFYTWNQESGRRRGDWDGQRIGISASTSF